jgi:hypothetical protein
VTVAIAAALPAEARSRVLSLAGITSDQSGSYRIGVWRDTIRLIGSSPIAGSGFGAYADALPRFKTAAGHLGIEHAENDHLELLAEGGLVGLALAGVSALVVVLSSLRNARAEERRLARALSTAALAGCVSLAFHGCLDFNLHIPANSLVAAFVIGTTLMSGRAASGTAGVPGPSAVYAAGVVVLTGSLLAGVLDPWTDPGRRPVTVARAARANAALRRSAVIRDVAALLKKRPAQASAWVTLGWLRLSMSRVEAAALARWGADLDPQHEALRRASTLVRESGR